MSNNIGDVLHSRMARTTETIVAKDSKTIVKTTVNCKGYKCTPAQVDLLVQDAAAFGVINPRMQAWYCKLAYQLGSELFMRCAAQAREGRDPVKLFSYLLNLELKKLPQGGGHRAVA